MAGFFLNHALASHPMGGPITNGRWVTAWNFCSADAPALVFLPHELVAVHNGHVKHMRRHEQIEIVGDPAHPRIRIREPGSSIVLVIQTQLDGDELRFTGYDFDTNDDSLWPKHQPYFDRVLAKYQSGEPYHRCPTLPAA